MLSPSIEAFTTGTARSASTTALMMNERYVSFAPARWYSAPLASRICATRVKFTSNTECTWADVRRLVIMCSAIFLRITDIGCTWPGTPLPRDGGA